jgi:hypothetical protein
LPNRLITLTTDFGLNDHFVGVMKGVILGIQPSAHLVDISHGVEPYQIAGGAFTIAQAYRYFPRKTIHVVVVDPGVGSARRPLLVEMAGQYFVAPDNGVLSMVYAKEERIHVRHINSEHYFRQPVSNTFHARDVFAPVAAYLAKMVDSHKFGDEIEDYVRFAAPKPKPAGENRLRAVVLKVDRFGNLITNVTPADAPALFAESATFKVVVGSREITDIRKNYAEGAPGEVFGILGSMGFLEIVANRAAAAQITGAGKGSEVNIFLGEAAAAGKGA